MRWLADECVDAGLVAHLRSMGHNVLYMAEVASAMADTALMARARAEGRLLLTEDKDFGELVFRQSRRSSGVILLRVDPARHALKKRRVDVLIDRYGDKLYGRYSVIDEARIRTRLLPE